MLFKFDKNIIQQYHTVIVSFSLHHYAVQTARNKSKWKNQHFDDWFLSSTGTKLVWTSNFVIYHRVQIPDWLSPWLVDQRSNGSNTDILGSKTGKMWKWWDEKIVDVNKNRGHPRKSWINILSHAVSHA